MAWRARVLLGMAAAFIAGSSLACEQPLPCSADRYGPAHHRREAPAYVEPYHHRTAQPPCRSDCVGEITLPASFFDGGGGVGPIPSGPVYGGGYYYVRGGGFGRAYASSAASAWVFSRVSVTVSRGRSGGCCH